MIQIVFNFCPPNPEPRMYIRGFCDFDTARGLNKIRMKSTFPPHSGNPTSASRRSGIHNHIPRYAACR
jgi:hypothetical protein